MTESVLIAHLADTHLGYRQYNLYERENDIYEMFQLAIEEALREHVELIVHAGDFFDSSRPPPQAIRAAIRILKSVKEHGVEFIATLGDHDIPKRRGDHPLAILEELGLLKVLLLKEKSKIQLRTRSGAEVFIAGLPHHRKHSASTLRTRLSSLKPPEKHIPRILVLHQGLEGYAPEPEIGADSLPKGYSYYALGHVHRPSSFRIDTGVAVYPGSIDALRIDEAQYEHGFVIADVYWDSADYTFEKLPIRPQPVYTVRFESLSQDLARIASQLLRYSKKPLVHIIVRGSNIDRQKVYKLVKSMLEGKTLYTHLAIYEDRVEAGNVRIDRIGEKLDRYELLVKLLQGDRELAKLVDTMIDMVAHGAKEVELEHLVEQYYRSRYGGGEG